MANMEQLAFAMRLRPRGVRVLAWEHKPELVRALLLLQAGLDDFPKSPVVVPTEPLELQKFSLGLFETTSESQPPAVNVLIIPHAAIESLGGWLNGWRHRLSEPPGTLLVIRRADMTQLFRRAPDLMSFVQSDIFEATGMLPLISRPLMDGLRDKLPVEWQQPLVDLPGGMPTPAETSQWIKLLRANLE